MAIRERRLLWLSRFALLVNVSYAGTSRSGWLQRQIKLKSNSTPQSLHDAELHQEPRSLLREQAYALLEK
jgi:hypothetical protein